MVGGSVAGFGDGTCRQSRWETFGTCTVAPPNQRVPHHVPINRVGTHSATSARSGSWTKCSTSVPTQAGSSLFYSPRRTTCPRFRSAEPSTGNGHVAGRPGNLIISAPCRAHATCGGQYSVVVVPLRHFTAAACSSCTDSQHRNSYLSPSRWLSWNYLYCEEDCQDGALKMLCAMGVRRSQERFESWQ